MTSEKIQIYTAVVDGPTDDNEKMKKIVTDLKRKITALESIRAEDLRKLSVLGALESEKEAWLNIRAKLRDKLQSQQQEIRDLKERTRVLEAALETANQLKEEGSYNTDEALEMATLDREMAEEERDHLKVEVEEQSARIEELTLELEILREQAAEPTVPADRSAAESRAIELQNDRLREALMRLKEISTEQEASLNSLNKENDQVVQDLQNTKIGLLESQTKLTSMEQMIEDLKDQVNISIGAEEMLESLTERNLVLGEQVEKYRAEISDLEALKELNDELEDNHFQAQKELTAELHLSQSVIAEQTSRLVNAEEQEFYLLETIEKFRGLVSTLQAEVAELQASEQVNQLQTSKLSHQTHELLIKTADLQNKGTRTSLDLLDLNLKRQEAASAIEHLSIVREYIAQICTDDQKTIEAYITMKSLGKLCRLLFDHFQGQMTSAGLDDLYSLGSISLILLQISSSFHHSAAIILLSTVEEFVQLAQIVDDVRTVEKTLKAVVDDVKINSTNEIDLLTSLKHVHGITYEIESMCKEKQATHDSNYCLWALEVGCLAFDAIASQISKVAHEHFVLRSNDGGEEVYSVALLIDEIVKLQKPIKIFLTEEGLYDRVSTGEAAASSLEITKSIFDVFETVLQIVKHVTDDPDDPDDARPDHQNDPVASVQQKIRKIAIQIEVLLNSVGLAESRDSDYGSQGQAIKPRLPWQDRVSQIKTHKSVDEEAQLQIKRLELDLQNIMLSIHVKSKQLEEEKVKVSALERRLLEYQGMGATIKALEASEAKFVSDRKAYEDAIDELNDQLESVQERIQQMPLSKEPSLPSTTTDLDLVSQEEIRILRKTVGHLAKKLASVQCSTSSKHMDFLTRPLLPDKNKRRTWKDSCYDKNLLEFYGQVKFVDFQASSPIDTRWVPMREKCGYIHYVQEETYAHLIANKSNEIWQR